MSYKRVVKKKGKSYGPYIYESYRDKDGKVKKRYLGKAQPKKTLKSNSFVVAVLAILLLVGIGCSTDFLFNGGETTGKFIGHTSSFFSTAFNSFTGLVVDDSGESGSSSEPDSSLDSVASGSSDGSDSNGPIDDVGSTEEVLDSGETDFTLVEDTVEEVLNDGGVQNGGENEEVVSDGTEIIYENETAVEDTNETYFGDFDVLNETNETVDLNESLVELNWTLNETNETYTNETGLNISLNETNESVIGLNETGLNISLNETNESVIGLNETGLNISLNETNETLDNVTLIFNEANVTEVNVTNVSTLQYRAVIHRPVKWIKTFNVTDSDNLTIELPKNATNISVLTDDEIDLALLEADKYDDLVDGLEREKISEPGFLTGDVVSDLDSQEGILMKIWKWLTSFTISGEVISGDSLGDGVVVVENSTVVNLSGVFDNQTEVAVEYFTPAPLANETLVQGGKRVVVHAEDEFNYTEILSYANLSGLGIRVNDSRLKVIWYADEEDAIRYGYLNATNETNESSSGEVLSDEAVFGVPENEVVLLDNASEENETVNETLNETVEGIFNETNETLNETLLEDSLGVNETGEEILNETSEAVLNETEEMDILFSANVVFDAGAESTVIENETFNETLNETAEGILNETNGTFSEVTISDEDNISFESNETVELVNLSSDVEKLLNVSNVPVPDGIQVSVDYVAYDFDEDGFVDYIEWVVPHLSAQVYEIKMVNQNVSTRGEAEMDGDYAHLKIDTETSPYDSLVSYYSFDGDNGTTAFDWAGDGDGTYENDTHLGFGVYDSGLVLGGNGDYVSIPSMSYTSGDNWSINMWAYVVEDANFMPVGKKASWNYIAIYYGADSVYFRNSTGEQSYVSVGSIGTDEWRMFTFQHNGSQGVDVFVDSIYKGNIAIVPDWTVDNIGAAYTSGDSSDFDFNGSIDEVMIFNDSLTAAEVAYIYNSTAQRFKDAGFFEVANQRIDGTENQINVSFDDYEETNGSNLKVGVGEWDISKGYKDYDLGEHWVDVASGTDNIDTIFNGTEYSELTFAFWAKTDELSAVGDNYVLDNSPGSVGYIVRQGSGTSTMYFYAYLNTNGLQSDTISIPDTNWHFYVARFNGTAVELFLDGVSSGSPATFSSDSLVVSNDLMKIGNGVGNTGGWAGSIDEVMAFNDSLTDSEIVDIYNLGRDIGYFYDDNLVSWWGFDRDYTDKVGSNDGTASGVNLNGANGNYNGLVSYWHADGDAVDSVGSNDGVLVGGAHALAEGVYGNSFGLEGDDDYINISKDVISSDSFSVALWSYTSSGRYLLNDGDDPANFLIQRTSGVTPFQVYVGDSSQLVDGLPLDSWHHIVVTHNSSGVATVYLDGALNFTISGSNFVALQSNLLLGNNPALSRDLDGKIDELMIFNRTLSEEEVREIYVKGRASFEISESLQDITADDTANKYNYSSSSGISDCWIDSISNPCGGNSLAAGGNAAWSDDDLNVRNYSMNFDGVGDHFNVSPAYGYYWSEDYSVSGWFKASDVTSDGQVILDYSCTDSLYGFSIMVYDGGLSVYSGFDGAVEVKTTGLNNQEWHHFTFVQDYTGTSSVADFYLYLDGKLVDSKIDTSIDDNAGGGGVTIGAASDTSSPCYGFDGFFNGSIDEVAIWNRSLSDSEIKDIYVETKDKHSNNLFNLTIGTTNVLPFLKLEASSSNFYTPLAKSSVSISSQLNTSRYDYSTGLDVFDSEADDESQAPLNRSAYVADEVIFYANYTNSDGETIGTIIGDRVGDLGTGYNSYPIDLNLDGIVNDFVYGESDDIRIYWANGTEKCSYSNSTYDYAYALASGDFDNDGVVEVAHASSGGIFRIINSSCGDEFATADLGSLYDMEVADIDDDGHVDDFLVGDGSGNVHIYSYNESSGTYSEVREISAGTSRIYDVDFADVEGDEDLIGFVDYSGTGAGHVYWANGTEKKITADYGYAYGIEFFDMDSDGDATDVAFSFDYETQLYYSNGTYFGSLTGLSSGNYGLDAIDLDGDGIKDDLAIGSGDRSNDIAAVYGENASVAWYFSPPDKPFETDDYSQDVQGLTVDDVTGDGFDDVIVITDDLRYFILDRNGEIEGKYSLVDEDYITQGVWTIGSSYGDSLGLHTVDDINGDGIRDILFSHTEGYVYYAQQVDCRISISGHYREEIMDYNYTSGLFEYHHFFNDSDFDRSNISDSNTYYWNVTCSKGGYQTQTVSDSNLTVSWDDGTLDAYDLEDDSEDKAGWLSEVTAYDDTNMYFFANYTNSSGEPVRDFGINFTFIADIGDSMYATEIFDYDQDGVRDEYLFAEYGSLAAYWANGTQIWEATEPAYWTDDLVVGDFDNDSYDDIAFPSYDGYMYIFNYTGDQVFKSSSDVGYIRGDAELIDANGDGVDDVVSVWYLTTNTGGAVSYFYNFSSNAFEEYYKITDTGSYPAELKVSNISSGEDIMGWCDGTGLETCYFYWINGTKISDTGDIGSSAYAFDFIDYDGDGEKDEVVVGEQSNSYIYWVYNGSQAAVHTPSSDIAYETWSFDADDDGVDDAYLVVERTYVRAIWYNGTQIWYDRLPIGYYSSAAIEDLDGDGTKEIVIVKDNGILYLYDLGGNLLERMNILLPFAKDSSEDIRAQDYTYGSSNGLTFTDFIDGKKYLVIGLGDAYGMVLGFYPMCMVNLDDGTTLGMHYNSTAELYSANSTFDQGNYTWNINCTGDSYPIDSVVGTLNVSISPNVTGCKVLDQNGSYTLRNDLSTSEWSCINITADNITFDLMGYDVVAGNYGIYVSSVNYANVTNGTSVGSGSEAAAVWLDGSNYSHVSDMSASNQIYGYYLTNSYNNNLDNLSFDNSGSYCIYLSNSSNNLFIDNYLTSCGTNGVYVASSSQNNTFVNLTSDSEGIYTNSELIRAWHYRGYFNDSEGGIANTTNVLGYLDINGGSALDMNLTANSTGHVSGYLTEYVQNTTSKYYRNNQTLFYATNNGSHIPQTREFNLSQSHNIDEYVTFIYDATDPSVSYVNPTPSNDATVDNYIENNLSVIEASDYYSFSDFNNSLIGYWRGEGNLIDESDGYLSLDGTGDYVDCSWDFTISFDASENWTYSVWFNASSGTSQYDGLFSEGINSVSGFDVSFDSGNGLQVFDHSTSSIVASTDPVSLNEWHNLVMVYEGGDVDLYVDGALNASGSGTFADSIGDFLIGYGVDYSQVYDGSIDNFLLFNRTLNSEEVDDLYNIGRKSKYVGYSGLVSAWLFDSQTDAAATDSIGPNDGTYIDDAKVVSGLNGVALSGATTTIHGKFGSAFEFDGSDDCIQVPENDDLNFTSGDAYTYSAWINSHEDYGASSYAYVVSKRDNTAQQGGLYISGDDLFLYQWGGADSSAYSSSNPLAGLENEWVHVAATFDGTSVGRVYVNGVDKTSDTSVDPAIYAASDFFIGCRGNNAPTTAYNFNGSIDEVLVFNRELSATEIMALYNSTRVDFNNTELPSGLYAYIGYAVDGAANKGETAGYKATVQDWIRLDSPDNGSMYIGNNVTLNTSVYYHDPDEVIVYASYDEDTFDENNVVYVGKGVSAGDVLSKGFVTVPMNDTTSPLFLLHMDNLSVEGNNYTTGSSIKNYGSGSYTIIINDSDDLVNYTQESGAAGGGFNFSPPTTTPAAAYNTINILGLPSTTTDTAFTMSAWIKTEQPYNNTDPYEDYQAILGDQWGTNIAFGTRWNKLYLNLDDTGLSGTTTVTDGGWHNVVATFSGSTHEATLYVDGVQDAFNAEVYDNNGHSGFTELSIGKQNRNLSTYNANNPYFHFNGTIDEVAFWNVELSAAQVAALHQQKSGKYYWKANSSGGHNTDVREFSIDLIDPIVNLTAPADEYYSSNTNVWFNYSASDENGVDSCTLYGDFNGTWGANETNWTSGLSIDGAFNLVLADDSTYTWSVECNDTFGNARFNDSNRTLYVGAIPPFIELIYPANDSISTETFRWYASSPTNDSNLTCNLTVNSNNIESDLAVVNPSVYEIGTIASSGDYNVTCWLDSNPSAVNSSLTYSFTLDTSYPDINITSPSNFEVDDNVTITSAASDNNNVSLVINFNNSLVSWWTFDEYNRSKGLVDRMGLNNASPAGDVSFGDGEFGSAGVFDGDEDYYDVAADPSLDSGEVTISLWAKMDVINRSNHRVLLNKQMTNPRTLMIYHLGSSYPEKYGHWAAQLRLDGFEGSSIYVFSDNNASTDWQHFVMTYDGDVLKMYIDGVLQSDTNATSGSIDPDSPGILRIGADSTTEGFGFEGSMDDLMIFNQSLTAAQVQALYANTSSKIYSEAVENLSEQNYTVVAYAQDNAGNIDSTSLNFNVNYPDVSIDVLEPEAGSINVDQNGFFETRFNVSCTGGNCGSVNVSLDPVMPGSSYYFERGDYKPEIDCVDDYVCLARDSDGGGFYNALYDSSYSDNSDPIYTEWANGTCDNPLSSFGGWTAKVSPALWGGSPAMLNQPICLHTLNRSNYIDINITSWTSSASGGGFAYYRETPKQIYFMKQDYGNETDCITDTVCITRGDSEGLFNNLTDTSYDGLGPDGTEWANGTCDNPLSSFGEWTNVVSPNVWGGNPNGPTNMMNQPICLHIISENYYLDVNFTNWTESASGGGFSYYRESIPLPKVGLISTVSGAEPFYTNSSDNPTTITLNDGEYQEVTFWVNATGPTGIIHDFFAFVNSSTTSASGTSSHFNVTIASSPDSSIVSPSPFDGIVYGLDYFETNVSGTSRAGNLSTFTDFGLVSWWRMDDRNTTHVLDYLGRNNGTVNGDARVTSAGVLGDSFVFDGNGDYLDAGSDSSMDITGDITISFWAKPAGGISTYTAFLGRGLDNGWGFYGDSGVAPDNIFFRVITDQGSVTASTSNIFTVGEWTHIVGRYNGSNIDVFGNGVEITSSAYAQTGSMDNSGTSLQIGKISDRGAYFFNGSIDDVMIYNRSLSNEEIAGLYADASTKYAYGNHTGVSDGEHTYAAYSQNVAGDVNYTSSRSVYIDTVESNVSFGSGTTANDSDVYDRVLSIDVTADDETTNTSVFIDLNDSLAGWWRMDEYNSTHILDYTGRNNCTISGAPVARWNDSLGMSFDFDGIDDYATCTNNGGVLNLSQNLTVVFWLAPDDLGDFRENPLEKSYGGEFAFTFELDGSISYYHGTKRVTGWYSAFTAIPSGNINAGEWSFVALTRDVDTRALKGYHDGVLVASTTYSSNESLWPGDSNYDVIIGNGYSHDFEGLMDNVMLFNRTLTPEEIEALYANSSSKHLEVNLTGLNYGPTTYKAYSQDLAGNVNVTETRELEVHQGGVSGCRDLNETDMVYVMTKDLSTTGTCFNITANNVTLDMAGYNITGDEGTGDYGVYVDGYNYTKIRNGEVYDFGYGIYFNNSNYGNVSNVTSNSCSKSGLYIALSSGNFVGDFNTTSQDLFTTGSGLGGLTVYNSNNTVITRVNASVNLGTLLPLHGIVIEGYGNSIDYSTVNYNDADGIFVDGGDNNSIRHTNASFNSQSGVYFSSSINYNSTLFNLTLNSNNDSGFFSVNFYDGNLSNITANSNRDYGVSCTSGGNNSIDDFYIWNSTTGIYLSGLDNSNITNGVINLTSSRGFIASGTPVGILVENVSFEQITDEGINIGGGSANQMINNTFDSSPTIDYLVSDGAVEDYDFNGNSLEINDSDGEIKFLSDVTASGTNLSSVISINSNSAFVNTSKDSGLNVSANVSLRGLALSDPNVLVDYNDNGTFEDCSNAMGCYNLSYSGGTFVFNVSHFTTYSSEESNIAPDDPSVSINFSGTTNTTVENVTCTALTSDPDGDSVIVSTRWYWNGTLNATYNSSSISNNTNYTAFLFSGNTTKHDNWSCEMKFYDASLSSAWVGSSNVTVLNSLPTVSLVEPVDDNSTYDRTPLFNWTGSDADGDSLTYDWQIDDELFQGGASCTDDDLKTGLVDSNYTPSVDLACLYDNGYRYKWRVRAKDDEDYGVWTNNNTLYINASIEIELVVNVTDFGSITMWDTEDTTDDSPAPLVVENKGNVLVNLSINSTALFETETDNSSYYQYKVDQNSGEEGAFDFLNSITSWADMPITGSAVAIWKLNYTDSNDTAEIDIKVQSPLDEGPGDKGAVVTLYSSLAE